MDREMDKWMDGWVGGWMDRWRSHLKSDRKLTMFGVTKKKFRLRVKLSEIVPFNNGDFKLVFHVNYTHSND